MTDSWDYQWRSAVHLHSYLLKIKWCIGIYQPRCTVGPHHIYTVYSNTYWASYDCRHSAGDYTPGHQVGCNGYRWCWSYIPTYGTSNGSRINHDKPLVLNIYEPRWTVGPHHIYTVYYNTYWAPNDCRHSAGDYTPGRHQVGCTIYPPYISTRTEHLTTIYSPYTVTRTEHQTTTGI